LMRNLAYGVLMIRRIEPFLLVVVDDDRHVFSVAGPMTDDTAWNKRVSDAQDRGRRIPGRSETRDQVIRAAEDMGLMRTSDSLA
jgi:hypothetical protein